MCLKQVQEPAKRKLEAGVQQGSIAARPILALIDAEGAKSAWSQAMFGKVFASLPDDAASFANEAPNLASLFVRVAPEMELDPVKTAGLKLLLWLGKPPDSPSRSVAINMTTGTLSSVLGEDGYARLQDPSAEAISMLAVARVAMGQP
jgi:hypothetical protein